MRQGRLATLCRQVLSGLSLLLAIVGTVGCSSGDNLANQLSKDETKTEAPLHPPAKVLVAGGARREVGRVGQIKDFLIAHAPYKQVDARSGADNSSIGRSPASACDVIRFLANFLQNNGPDAGARAKLRGLADWVINLQSVEKGRSRYGGVPSTPDLAPPKNHYYFAIDAAFCGDAMFRAYELTDEDRHLASAMGFAEFLITMHRESQDRSGATAHGGFCEYVIDDGTQLVWNCSSYVKTLVALPVLRKATNVSGQQHFGEAARNARRSLVPGLLGAWEFAEMDTRAGCRHRRCTWKWRRIQGPHKQPDYFIYGDTVAYGLRGLYEYEGWSRDVQLAYDKFSSFKGKGPRSRAYDARICFAGYLHPATSSADEFSAYYDLVTLGILHELRRAHRKDHFAVANAALLKIAASAPKLSWKMQFDLSVRAEDYIDLTTLANLGEALLVARRPGP